MLKKKILSIILLIALCFTLNPIAVLANENDEDCDSNGYDPVEFKFEHINNGKTSSPMDLIKVTDDGTRIIVKNNLIPIAFNDHFTTKKYKDLNVVEFYIPCDITSNNAKCLIPAKSIVLGEISCIQQPKWGNRNAKVYITLKKLIFPNGRQFDICAKPYENGGVLKKSGWTNFGKAAAYTVGGFGLGAGNGAWIGACAGNAWTGTWIGMAIGGGTGLLLGLLTPGMHYKAKKGKVIYMRLCEDIIITPDCCNN